MMNTPFEQCRRGPDGPKAPKQESSPTWTIPIYRVELVREREITTTVATCPEDAAQIVWQLVERSDREMFVVLLLATDNSLIGINVVSIGSLAASVVGAAEVFKTAILANAAAIIVAHNHPSGNLEPSREDIRISRQLKEAGKMIGIPVHDSLIVSHRGYTSLAERGVMS
jgi:DNA repair protein RadC